MAAHSVPAKPKHDFLQSHRRKDSPSTETAHPTQKIPSAFQMAREDSEADLEKRLKKRLRPEDEDPDSDHPDQEALQYCSTTTLIGEPDVPDMEEPLAQLEHTLPERRYLAAAEIGSEYALGNVPVSGAATVVTPTSTLGTAAATVVTPTSVLGTAAATAIAPASVLGAAAGSIGIGAVAVGTVAIAASAVVVANQNKTPNFVTPATIVPEVPTATIPPDATTPTVQVVETEEGLSVSGQADPGEQITVRFADGSVQTVVTDAQGHYAALAKTMQPTTGMVEVVGKNANSTSKSVPISYTIPSINASVTPNLDGTLTVTGTATYPNATVIITYPDQTQSTVTADTGGFFTAQSLIAQNSGVVSVIGTNIRGDQSLPSNWIYVDQFPPFAPTLTAVLGNADGRVSIHGYAEAGSAVTITLPSNRIMMTAADPITGFFSVLSIDTEHNGTISVFSTDTVGNFSPTKTAVYINQTTPEAPTKCNITTNPDGIIHLEGSAIPDATVIVTFPSGSTGSVPVDGSGYFVIRSTAPQPSGPVSLITQLDGNQSAAATLGYTDITTPPGPTASVTSATNGTLTIQGTAEVGCTVTAQLPDGSVVQSAVVGANGLYSIPSPTRQSNGILQLYATDAAANRSVVQSKQYEYNAIPDTPVIQTVTSNPNGTVQITGTAIPGSPLTIQFPDGSAPQNPVVADTAGHFSAVSTTPQANTNSSIGIESIRVYTTLAAATSWTAQQTYTDTTPPQAAVLQAPTVNADGSLTITGSAEPYSTVQIQFPNGTTQSVLTNALGNFMSLPSALAQTSGTIQAAVTDLNGLSAAQSGTRTYVDTHIPLPPTLQLTTNPSGNCHLTVSGKSEPNSSLQITLPGSTSALATADAQGNYTWTSTTPILNGTVQVNTTSAAGQSAATPAIQNYVNAVAPTAPTITTITSTTTGLLNISGTAIPGTQVQINLTLNDGLNESLTGLLGSTTSNALGNYQLFSTSQAMEGNVSVVSTFSGLDSLATTQNYTFNGTAKSVTALSATTLYNGKIIVKGTAAPYSTVTLSLSSSSLPETMSTSTPADGHFTSPPSAFVHASTNITATSKFYIGSTSTATTLSGYAPARIPVEPIINTPSIGANNVLTVTGTAEPNVVVVLTYPDGSSTPGLFQAGKIISNAVTGAFTATSPPNQPAGVVTGFAATSTGSSPIATSGMSAIPTVTLTPDATGKLTVSGTTENNASVNILFPDGSTTTVVATGGNYSAQSLTKQHSGNIIVTATDTNNHIGQIAKAYQNLVPNSYSSGTVTVNPDGTITLSILTEPNLWVTGFFTPPGNTLNPTFTFLKQANSLGQLTYTTPLPQASSDISTILWNYIPFYNAVLQDSAAGNFGSGPAFSFTAATPQPPVITQAQFASDGTLTVTGTAQALSSVVVTFADGSTSAPVIANKNGQFSAAHATTAQHNGGITATAAFSGFTSAASSAFSAVSTTLPDSPTLNAPVPHADGSVTVSGTAIAGSTVNVRFPDPIGIVPVVADNTGHFSISSPPLLGGVPSGNITATTTWNSLSSPAGSAAKVVYTDLTLPALTVNAPAYLVSTGQMQITGTAEIGAVVQLVLADGSSVSTTVDATGIYALTSPGVAGSTGYTLFATDRSGLETQQTGTFTATLPPLAPTLDGTVTANRDGTLSITGHAQPKSTVQVTFPGGIVKQGVTDVSGGFVVVSAAPIIQSGSISVTATDALNHTSPAATTPFTLPLPTEIVNIIAMGKDTANTADFSILGVASATDFITHDGSAGRGVFGSINAPLKPGETLQASFDGANTWQNVNLNKTDWESIDLSAHTANWTLAARILNGDGLPGPVTTQPVTLNTAIPIAPTLTAVQATSATVSLAGTNATLGSMVHLVWGNATQDYALTNANIAAGTVTIPIDTAVLAAQSANTTLNVSAQLIDLSGQISAPSGTAAAPTIVAPPSASLFGTASDDTFSIMDLRYFSTLGAHLDGGAGVDTLRFAIQNNTFDLTALPGTFSHPVLHRIEKFDLGVAGTNTLKLSINEVLHLGQTDLFNPASGWTGAALAASGGHVNRVQLVIDGDATDTVALVSPSPAISDSSSWQLQSGQASFSGNGHTYAVYHHSTELAQLLIQQGLPVQIL